MNSLSLRHVWTHREGSIITKFTLVTLEGMYMFNDSLDNWRISLVTQLLSPWSEVRAAPHAKSWDSFLNACNSFLLTHHNWGLNLELRTETSIMTLDLLVQVSHTKDIVYHLVQRKHFCKILKHFFNSFRSTGVVPIRRTFRALKILVLLATINE